jgi:hypothetical protein
VLFLLQTCKVCQFYNGIDVIVQQLAALESLYMLDHGLQESGVLYQSLEFSFCCGAVFSFSQKWL